MLISPVEGAEIRFEDGTRTILNDSTEAVFLPGWRAVLAYGGLSPATIVTFVDEAGAEGVWFLDPDMERRGGSIWEIPTEMRADLLEGLCRLVDGIWHELVRSDRPRPPTEAERAFFALPPSTRFHLLDLYLHATAPKTSFRLFSEPASAAPAMPTLDCGSRQIPLRMQGLHALFDPGLLQREQIRLLRDGAMELPSPVDGRPLRCEKAFVVNAELTAYRLHDPRWGLTSYVLAGEIFFRTQAVYIPDANLVLCADPEAFAAQWPELAASFYRHIVRHGQGLFAYLAASDTKPLHVWRGRNALHLGHLLWNDLSGIAHLVQALPVASLPPFLLCDSGSAPEMYGPLDRIFPELAGKVLRRQEPLVTLIDTLYEMNVCAFRSSAMTVTANLRTRILADMPARSADVPVILLGLRTENRTLDQLAEFCRFLVAHLAATVGRVVLVVDGHNARQDGNGMIWSHGELQAPVSPVEVERELLGVMHEAARGTAVRIVDTLGQPVAETVAWCRAASFFVSFWGAGLAKYRWLCNTPGVVMTNRWNLANLNDLSIYSDPRYMDDPTEMSFVAADAVQDLPDSPLLIRHEAAFVPSLCNFSVDFATVGAAIDGMVRTRLVSPVPVVEVTPTPMPASRRKQRPGVRAPAGAAKVRRRAPAG